MSAHCSTREASGCVGCVVALAIAVGVLGATALACGRAADALCGAIRG